MISVTIVPFLSPIEGPYKGAFLKRIPYTIGSFPEKNGEPPQAGLLRSGVWGGIQAWWTHSSGWNKPCFLVNRVFVPCQKGAVLTKTAENDAFAFYPLKQGLRSSNPRKRRKWRKWRKLLRKRSAAAPRQSEICVKFSVFHTVFLREILVKFSVAHPNSWKT